MGVLDEIKAKLNSSWSWSWRLSWAWQLVHSLLSKKQNFLHLSRVRGDNLIKILLKLEITRNPSEGGGIQRRLSSHRRLSSTKGRLPTEGHLPMKVVFHQRSSSHRRSSSNKGRLPTDGRLPTKVVLHRMSSSTYHNTLVHLIFVRAANIPNLSLLPAMHDAWCLMLDSWCMMHDEWCSWSYICENGQHTKFQPPTVLISGQRFF